MATKGEIESAMRLYQVDTLEALVDCLLGSMRYHGHDDWNGTHAFDKHDVCVGCGVVRRLGNTVTCDEAREAVSEAHRQ